MSKENQLSTITPPESADVTALLRQAIEKDVPVETMEKLLTMRRELRAEWARDQYHTALANFQSELPVIKKTRKVMNKDGKTERYSYAPLDSIVAQVKKLLEKHGFSHREDATIDGKFVKAQCIITHRHGHSETSEFAVPIDPTAYMNDAQKYASALTFSKRYAFCDALGILTGDADTDTVEIANEPDKPERHRRTTAYEEKTGEGDPAVSADVTELQAFLAKEKIPDGFLLRLLQDKKMIDGHTKSVDKLKPGILRKCLDPKSKSNLIAAWAAQRADEASGSATLPEKAPERGPFDEPAPTRQSKPEARAEAKKIRQPVVESEPRELLEQEGYDDWREVPIHWGDQSGQLLGKIGQKSLSWWVNKWTPTQWRNRWKANDLLLDAALCLASAEFGGNI